MSGEICERLKELEEGIRKLVTVCLSSSKDPYTSGQMYTKLYDFMQKTCNERFRSSLWPTVEAWINDEQEQFYIKSLNEGPVHASTATTPQTSNSTDNHSKSSTSSASNSDPDVSSASSSSTNGIQKSLLFSTRRRELEYHQLKECFKVFSNEIKRERGDSISIDEVFRFRECLSVLPESDFEPLISELWTSFLTKGLDTASTSGFTPKVRTIADFDNHVSAELKTCFVCSEDVTYKKISFRQHLVDFHSIYWFCCSSCDYYSSAKRYLHRHARTIHFVCNHCCKQFQNVKQVDDHILKTHTSSSTKDKEKRSEKSMTKENFHHDHPPSKRQHTSADPEANDLFNEAALSKKTKSDRAFQSKRRRNHRKTKTGSRRRRISPSPDTKARLAPTVIEKMREIIRHNRTPGEVCINYVQDTSTGSVEPEVGPVKPAFTMTSVGTQTETSVDESFSSFFPNSTLSHDTHTQQTPVLAEVNYEHGFPPTPTKQFGDATPPSISGVDAREGASNAFMQGGLDMSWIGANVEVGMNTTLAELNGSVPYILQSEYDNLFD